MDHTMIADSAPSVWRPPCELCRPWRGRCLAVLWVATVWGLVQPARSTAQSRGWSRLPRALAPLIERHAGRIAVTVWAPSSGMRFDHHADEPMPTASLIKVAVLTEAFRQIDRGALRLDQRIILRPGDTAPGSGIITGNFSPGTTFSLRDLLRLMIVESDNTATNLVVDQVGLRPVRATMKELGLAHTAMYAKVFHRETSIDLPSSRRFGLGSTTAREMSRLLRGIQEGSVAQPASCRSMRSFLLACRDRQKLLRYLPRQLKVAHKGGAVSDARCDAGWMELPSGPVFVVVLTADNRDQRWTTDNRAEERIGAIARCVFDLLSDPKSPSADGLPDLRADDEGELVRVLQRSLNTHAARDQLLDVDGVFGPQTEGAVKRFQGRHGLPVTGRMDRRTWEQLLPLAWVPTRSSASRRSSARQDPPSLPPLPAKRRESLDGPPAVSCRAWVIGDGETGRRLAGWNDDVAHPPASTTKLMTALVVVASAQRHPELLEDVLSVSTAAAATGGSTAQLRRGDQVPVRELLYGLLLPSGNDAAVALAEHVGARLVVWDAARTDTNPTALKVERRQAYDRFIRAMNEQAAVLKMKESHFTNPHGLTDPKHVMSARDLLKLAHRVREFELLCRIMATRRYVGRLQRDGRQHHVVWRNTNRLLRWEGYDGVKTGTTSAAGACLVASGERDGMQRIVVVLGASGSPARYADARNLFRYSWRQGRSGAEQE